MSGNAPHRALSPRRLVQLQGFHALQFGGGCFIFGCPVCLSFLFSQQLPSTALGRSVDPQHTAHQISSTRSTTSICSSGPGDFSSWLDPPWGGRPRGGGVLRFRAEPGIIGLIMGTRRSGKKAPIQLSWTFSTRIWGELPTLNQIKKTLKVPILVVSSPFLKQILNASR